MNHKTLALLCLGAICGTAHASSDQAWAELEQAMQRACIQASGLKNPKLLGNSAQFDDQVGYSALLLQGQYPQKHMQGRSGIELCLYHRSSRKAVVSEWDAIRPALKAR
ncbi:hypothetical protein I9018_26490 [Pseudomonas sp. MPFS]|uniref:hypothetical protein n=1 Tax=Pseudomonas sp. MPFS TaxID=2795724 RepID=UPI001F133DEF|nr:hypothetical protein [Pseudomonas sp. MPFS]UMZ10995.1 hypothetical protein I9018_26490 [Pseudomonas sp. MPFS]